MPKECILYDTSLLQMLLLPLASPTSYTSYQDMLTILELFLIICIYQPLVAMLAMSTLVKKSYS